MLIQHHVSQKQRPALSWPQQESILSISCDSNMPELLQHLSLSRVLLIQTAEWHVGTTAPILPTLAVRLML